MESALSETTGTRVFRKLAMAVGKWKTDTYHQSESSDVERFMNLSLRQISCLKAIHHLTRQNPEGISLKTLSAYIHITLPAASVLIDTMVKKELVERSENQADRRSLCIRLSQKGMKQFERLDQIIDSHAEELFAEFSPSEQDIIRKAADLLYSQIYQYEE